MKYAVLSISGTQYKVEENKTITVDKLEAKEGDSLTSDQVLLIVDDKDVKIGDPTVKNATIDYKVTKHYQGEKLRIFRYKGKSRYHKTHGFRAQLTDIQITKINY